MPIDARTLYDIARAALRPMELGQHGEAGQVACALETENGDIFTGICIDLPCGLGFCAEQAAAAQMLKGGHDRHPAHRGRPRGRRGHSAVRTLPRVPRPARRRER